MKKLFTPLLMLAALLSSTQAWAEDYNLYVGGVQVTDANKSNIKPNGLTSGTISYNNGTLTFNNVTLTTSTNCVYYNGTSTLELRFSGTNTLTTTGTSSHAIYALAPITLNGGSWNNPPTLNINANNVGSGGYHPIYANFSGQLSIWNLYLNLRTSGSGAIVGKSDLTTKIHSSCSEITASCPSGNAVIRRIGSWDMSDRSILLNNNVFNSSTHQTEDGSGNPVSSITLKNGLYIGRCMPRVSSSTSYSYSPAGKTAGTISYFNNTLTLNAVTFSTNTNAIVNYNIPDLNIVTTGECSITSTSGNAFRPYKNTTFTGSGTLKLTASDGPAISTYSGSNVTIGMVRLEAVGSTYGYYGESNSQLVLNEYPGSQCVYVFSGKNCNVYSGQIIMNNIDIWTKNTYFNNSNYKIYCGEAVATTETGATYFASKSYFTYYNIWVGGVQVSNQNKDRIYSPYLTAGTVNYNSDSKTLTLNGVTMDVTADDVNAIKTTSGAGDITIKAVGNNTLTSVADAAKLYSNTTFTSSSTADLRFISKNNSGISMYGSANATVNMVGFFQGKGAEYGFFGDGNTYPSEMLTLKKASSDELGYNFTGDQGGIYNLGSLKLDNMDFWYSTHGCYFDEADHRVEVNGGAVAKGPVVFGSIKEALPVSVCGKNLNRVNGADKIIYVGSKYIRSGAESVGYDPSTKTLKLDNANIDYSAGNNTNDGIILTNSGTTLNISVQGNNTLAGSTPYAGLWLQGSNVTLEGSGTLNVSGGRQDNVYGLQESTITVKGNMTLEALTKGIGTNNDAKELIVAENAVVKAKQLSRVKTLTLNDGQTIVEPFKAAFNSTNKRVEVNGSLAQNVVIQKVEKYDLAVCDVDVNSYNKDDILRDGGAFKYDPSTKRLTIKEADIDDPDVSEGVYNYGIEGLNIAIEGENHFRVKDDVFKMTRSTIFSGDGSVKGELTASDGFGIYLYDSGSTYTSTLNGPKFEFTGYRAVGGSANNLVIEKGCLVFNPNSSSARILNVQNLTLGSGMIIAKPQGGTFDSSQKGIVVNGSLYNGHAVISQKGDVNVDGTVTIADAVAVLNAMAGQEVAGNPDVNGDKEVSIADFVAVLNIMAGQ